MAEAEVPHPREVYELQGQDAAEAAFEAVRARGLTLAGWICNRIDPEMLEPEENVAYLRSQLGAPLLADLGFGTASDPRAASLLVRPDWL